MACPAPITQAELLVLLAEARSAYHKLMTGSALAEIRDQNGENVRFTAARKADLYAYIQDLERQLTADCGRPRPNRPMGFVF